MLPHLEEDAKAADEGGMPSFSPLLDLSPRASTSSQLDCRLSEWTEMSYRIISAVLTVQRLLRVWSGLPNALIKASCETFKSALKRLSLSSNRSPLLNISGSRSGSAYSSSRRPLRSGLDMAAVECFHTTEGRKALLAGCRVRLELAATCSRNMCERSQHGTANSSRAIYTSSSDTKVSLPSRTHNGQTITRLSMDSF